jgi:hypothetical protein
VNRHISAARPKILRNHAPDSMMAQTDGVLDSAPFLATDSLPLYASRAMQKMSKVILDLAERLLAQPAEKTSSEGCAAALLLAHVAWNRTVDPLGGDQLGLCRKGMSALKAENPKCLRELKSKDCEAMIQELVNLKRALYPADDRIIRLCALNPQQTVRVEWHHRGVEGTN